MSGQPPSPDLKSCEKGIVSLAEFLRHNDIIKQRPSLLGGQRWDMFKGKRAVRALLDPAYEKARKSNASLPEIKDRVAALENIAQLVQHKFAVNVVKLETEDAIARGLKPQSGVPVVLISPKQQVGDDEYLVWSYNPVPLKTYLYAAGLALAGIAIALYQLWPLWARKLSYYFSLACMGLVGVLIGISIVRLALFVVSVVVLPKGFWLFPNLYADVGFFQSFLPLWAWSGEKTLPPKPKLKKRKSKKAAKDDASTGSPADALLKEVNGGAAASGLKPDQVPPGTGPILMRQTPNGPVPVGRIPPDAAPQMMHPFIRQMLQVAAGRAEARLRETLSKEGPKSEAELNTARRVLMEEEMQKLKVEMEAAKAQIESQQ